MRGSRDAYSSISQAYRGRDELELGGDTKPLLAYRYFPAY